MIDIKHFKKKQRRQQQHNLKDKVELLKLWIYIELAGCLYNVRKGEQYQK